MPVNADCSGLRGLGPGTSPDWSPDGSRIAYKVAARIHTVSPDGGRETRVPGTGDSAALALSGETLRWSPDGRSILAGRIGTGFVVIGVDGRPRPRLGEGSVGLAGWAPDSRVVASERSIVTFGYRYALLAVDGSGRSRLLGPLVSAARRAGTVAAGAAGVAGPAPPLTS